jgi:hypothetical protein
MVSSVGRVAGEWNVNLLIALILMLATYALFRDVRALRRLATRNEQAQLSHMMILLQRSS